MIFVFGSNLAGRHGKGAALCARNSHGAEYGVGVGRTGNSYAIPTKDERIKTLPLYRIEKYVAEFLAYAKANPGLEFEVTKIGCGLAGYKEHQISPMFEGAPDNCHLPDWGRAASWGPKEKKVTVTRIKGPTIMLASGRYFDLEDPASSEFCIEDIAHALAHICRYTGHCRTFYSVAQHSVLVSHVVPPEHAFHGLMHDSAEAFIGDVAKPLKILLPDYKVIEDRIESAVFARFGLPAKLPQCVKDADRVLLRTEQRDLMGADGHLWSFTEGTAPLPERIEPLPPAEAKWLFLTRYAALRPNAKGQAREASPAPTGCASRDNNGEQT